MKHLNFNELEKRRISFNDYFDIEELEVGIIPYQAINKALSYEIFMRKFTPSLHWSTDLEVGIPSAVLVYYPKYLDFLYEYALQGKSYKSFFQGYPPIIVETFEYLFPSTITKLDKLIKNIQKMNNGIFEETNIKRLK